MREPREDGLIGFVYVKGWLRKLSSATETCYTISQEQKRTMECINSHCSPWYFFFCAVQYLFLDNISVMLFFAILNNKGKRDK